MSDNNQYLVQQAAVLVNPLTFTTTLGAADAAAAMPIVRANIQLIIDELKYEGTDGSHARLFFDEMSPQARISLYKVMTDLLAKSPNIA